MLSYVFFFGEKAVCVCFCRKAETYASFKLKVTLKSAKPAL